MRSFAWFLGLTALALAAIAVFAYPAWTLPAPVFDFPFHRVGERIGMLALLAGFLLVARRLRLADRASLGYGLPRRAFLRETSLGLALGVASMLAVVGLMTALGLLDWRPAAGLTGMESAAASWRCAPAAASRLRSSKKRSCVERCTPRSNANPERALLCR